LSFEPVPDSLVDPGFEKIPKIPTWFSGWKRYGCVEGIAPNGWHTDTKIPEHPEGLKAYRGEGFYGCVAGSNIKDGMIYQTISCEPDVLYEVSVWSYTYQTKDGMRGDVANRLGVDPTGQEDPGLPYVLWTPYTPSHKEWSRLSLEVRPVRDRMTIYLHHLQVHGLTFNCNLFDEVEVRKIEEAGGGP
jgi:hypothetical protein